MNYRNHHQSIKTWSEDDRPREKLLQKGRSILSDAELVAILLGSGSRSKSALDLAKELLQSVENDLIRFSKLTSQDLMKFSGIGEAKAVTLIAALELGRRRKTSNQIEKLKFTSSKAVYEFIAPFLLDLQHEEFHVIYLNRASQLIQHKQLSIGGMAGTVVDAKLIFNFALELKAQGLILIHNHPSGTKAPSVNDEKLTKNLVEFGKMIDLPILDHLIFTDNGYFSFADEGKLN